MRTAEVLVLAALVRFRTSRLLMLLFEAVAERHVRCRFHQRRRVARKRRDVDFFAPLLIQRPVQSRAWWQLLHQLKQQHRVVQVCFVSTGLQMITQVLNRQAVVDVRLKPIRFRCGCATHLFQQRVNKDLRSAE
uniref:(northern house mosquito) hypothetical protein n=1 Tax=Culex pipiens TaxID=7175 RepID=A0A8D8GPI7_CULPI